jgi:hypothetical protein
LLWLAAGLVLFIGALAPDGAAGEILEISADLLDEIEDIRSDMPGRDSEGFDPPSGADADIWRTIAAALLAEEIDTVDSLVSTCFPEYQLYLFTDTGLDSSQYYLLKETPTVTRGWGTLILRMDHEREIAIEIPHPRYEINTPSEGGDIFRRTGARFFIMAGTHRCANSEHSPCDGTSTVCGDGAYHVSDMAHLTVALYQAAHEAFTVEYPEGYSFSLHGTSRSTCEDIFLSNGHESDSQQILYDLRNHMLASGDITVGIAGDGVSTCTLHGGTNTQGRYTNGSPEPCTQGVTSTTGFFIHAEQQRRVRDSLEVYSKFIDAINEVIASIHAGLPATDLEETGIDISAPYPNPCSDRTGFTITVRSPGNVRVEVFDALGHRVALIHEGVITAARPRHFEVDGRSLSAGIYFIRASSGQTAVTRTVTILR